MQKNKDIYRKFCETKENLPVFFYDWWLDAVCKSNNWDVAVVKPDNDVLAFMPYYIKNILGFKLSILPRFTQFLGPWINYPNDLKKTNKPEFEKKMMNKLIDQLPETHYFEQNFHYSVKNWLPFYWKDYQQTTRYTYIIDDITFPERIFSDFTAAKRKNINKAREQVEVKYDLGSDEFYEHH
ncbi:MAG: methicillin resistance protein, partial [Candidatus Delongbacteria bacterium]